MSLRTPDAKEDHKAAQTPQEYYDDKFNDEEKFKSITSNYSSPADELKELEDYANSGNNDTGEIERYANNPKDAAKKNINEAKAGEENAAGPIKADKFTGTKRRKEPFKLTASDIKKHGPMVTIVLMLFGGGGLLGTFVAPGLGIIQAKEAFVKDLNDQLAAVDITSDHLFRTKLKAHQAGASICSNMVNFRCKLGTMSKTQVRNFKEAGFLIAPDKGDGRVKPTSITFPPDNQGNPGKTITDPNELRAHLRGNIVAQSQIRRAWNPKFASLTDKLANAVLLRLHIDKSPKIPSTNDREAQEKAVTNAAQGVKGKISVDGYDTDKDGRKYVVDKSGKKVYESGEGSDPARFKELVEENLKVKKEIEEKMAGAKPGSSAVGNFFSSVARGVRLTGALDTACTVYNLARATAAAAKAARTLQEAQWAMATVLTPADQFKAQDGTQEIATFVGNTLSKADNNKTIKDETTIKGVDSDGNPIYGEKPNPDYLKTAWDSRGYKLAAYNDPRDATTPLSAREQQFTAGGGLTGTLSGVLDTITKTLGLGNGEAGRKAIRSTCSVIQSWWVRTIGLVAGLVSAVGSFGASTAISIGASVAIGFAMPFLQSAMADILAGTVVSGKTHGVDAGNVGFVGTSEVLGKTAAGRGLRPANRETQKAYELVGKEVQEKYIAMDTYEARKTPFDITNQHSFLGSIIWKVNPIILKSNASITGAFLSIPTLLGTALSSTVPLASAAEVFNEERFKQCKDEGYFELNIDADVFCNVRYIMTNKQLAMDPDTVAKYMEDAGHAELDGAPKSDAYKRWIKACTEREAGWAETSNEEPEDIDAETGKICMEVTEQNDNFVVYTITKTVQEAMDEDPEGADAPKAQQAWYTPTSIGNNTMEPAL